jgi:hypothetical protein
LKSLVDTENCYKNAAAYWAALGFAANCLAVIRNIELLVNIY